MIHAICIKDKDNVGTAVIALKAEQTISYSTENGVIKSAFIKEDIPVFHKFALTEIPKDAPVIKYGEHSGFAKEQITAGQYVHIHNVYSKRENLRRKQNV